MRRETSNTTRWLIEGEWSGYVSAQRRVCHREVISDKGLAEKLRKAYGITYTDGTMLLLTIRPMTKGERATDLRDGYSSLIRECAHHDIWTVSGLQALRAGP